MIIDGVLGSQAIDSSGEVLSIEGADISDLEEGRGVLNYEHQSAEDKDEQGKKKNQGQEIVGKIVTAKKIFSEADCDNSRQRTFWRKIKTPFIYGVCRLYDGAGHEGAKALAAQIRDHHANKEPILVRFSVEGSTLDKDENILRRSVIRRVALTLKPCNRTADSGLIEDPNAPEGWDKRPDRKDLLEMIGQDSKKFEHPGFTRLGGAEVEYTPFTEDDTQALVKAMVKLKVLRKTITAGGGDVAPSSLSGGAALSREHLIGQKTKAMSLFKEYRRKGEFDKSELRGLLKMKMPEASDDFLDHFTDLAHEYTVKLKKADQPLDHTSPDTVNLEKDEAKDKKFGPPITNENNPFPEPRPDKHPEAPAVDRSTETPGIRPAKRKGGLEMKTGGKLLMPKPGITGSARLGLQQHFPNDSLYKAILDPDWGVENGHIDEDQHHQLMKTVHEPWHRAMSHWIPLNKGMSEGKVPKSIIAKSVIFAAMSPNTSVPMQERYFGHYMDMLHEGKVDPLRQMGEEAIGEFEQRCKSGEHPKWNRAFYEGQNYGGNDGDLATEHDPNHEMPAIRGLRNAHLIFGRLEHLLHTHKDDAQAISGELMHLKNAHKLEHGRTHPDVNGYGPKLTRYLLSMMGGGNSIVPDRHMIRSSFDLQLTPSEKAGKFETDPVLKKLTLSLTDAKNENLLRAMDHNFHTHHPAVRHVLNTFPKHFQGRETQANFPAFWLHWLTIKHYDQMRNRPHAGFNTDTDHMVFWDSVRDEMIKHGLNPHPIHDKYKAQLTDQDDSFDFGENLLKKAEQAEAAGVDPWPRIQHHNDIPVWMKAAGVLHALTQQWGENAALFAHFSHVIPHMQEAEHLAPAPPVQHAPHPAYQHQLFRMEALLIDLKKASAPIPTADPNLMAVAPHLNHVYTYRAGPDNKIRRHPSGRFLTAGNHLNMLEDYHGDLNKGLSEGPMDEHKVQQIKNLAGSNRHEVVPYSDMLSGKRPELLPTPEAPTKPAASFDYHRLDATTPDHLEFKNKIAHLNGHPLNEEQVQSLFRHAQNGHAKIRYRQDVSESVQKMEAAFTSLFKADEGQANGVHQALGKLDELVRAGHLDPAHAQALRSHAFVDPMTGTGNKFAYSDFLSRHGGNDGVHMVMDGNDFKSVNDKFGHETGDRAIKSFGEAMRGAMADTNGVGKLFRIGGDEFAAHMPTHEHAAVFARALNNRLSKMTPIQGTHRLSMSMGLGPTPEHADKALYEAKKQKLHPSTGQPMYEKGTAPNMAHSLMPGFEGAVPLDQSQLQVNPPPAAPVRQEEPAQVIHTPPGSAPAAAPGSAQAGLAAKPA